MDLVKTLLLYMAMVVSSSTFASPEVTPLPVSAIPTPTPYVSKAPLPIETMPLVITPSKNYPILRKGDKGNNVRALQTRLIELGYLTGSADGNFGNYTRSAVIVFQHNNGLTADGVAGKDTHTMLFDNPNVVTKAK